jgi:hypothetical protein
MGVMKHFLLGLLFFASTFSCGCTMDYFLDPFSGCFPFPPFSDLPFAATLSSEELVACTTEEAEIRRSRSLISLEEGVIVNEGIKKWAEHKWKMAKKELPYLDEKTYDQILMGDLELLERRREAYLLTSNEEINKEIVLIIKFLLLRDLEKPREALVGLDFSVNYFTYRWFHWWLREKIPEDSEVREGLIKEASRKESIRIFLEEKGFLCYEKEINNILIEMIFHQPTLKEDESWGWFA